MKAYRNDIAALALPLWLLLLASACSGVASTPVPFGVDAAGSSSGGAVSGGSGSSGSAGASSGGGPSGSSSASAGSDSGAADASSPGQSSDAAAPGDAASGDAAASNCPAPPSSEPAASITAVDAINATRTLVGVPCTTLVPALDTSAQLHCAYYAANTTAAAPCTATTSNAHTETAGCTGFVAAQFSARETMAGYTGRPSSEVMAFTGSPTQAVQTWIDSVWHRIPLLSPWIRDMGYGGTTTPARCDTIDFGAGATTPGTVTAFYPYAGQTGVPTSFDGSREGPTPPAPPAGWPSGYPVILFLQNGAVQSHTITVDGTTTPIAHVWIDPTNTTNFPYDYILYANTPLATNTTYHVQIAATQGSTALTFDWKFTTGAK
ncbi:MAG TPA: hypothetical protein VE987_08860 [Polyangiaceae bacterium]|nr:hypothetical protein [Polyangiaceae bacterium]